MLKMPTITLYACCQLCHRVLALRAHHFISVANSDFIYGLYYLMTSTWFIFMIIHLPGSLCNTELLHVT
jgi:hypothetical protein